ncbi:MAG: LPXTG cell wall anchor domain-containing protein [Oscillospiraceae bacterium]|nr:LPXTG cell wall anchor domain-containing protein [Oscillospiraceae bacterium]
MKNTVLTYIDRFRHDRHVRVVLGSVLLILALTVASLVYWQLRLSGIAMTNETYCGYEEHTHTEDCYESVLICGFEEIEGHVHDETCYDEEGNLICELEEFEGHTHSEECYETTLICELEEHVHTVDCLVDLEADVETAVDWEATLPELTGDLRIDIVNIAYSQLGYTESTANYTLAEDGITHLGYTRYGAWYGGLYYGSEYSDWDSMFVAFCLDYAGIAEELTYNSGAFAWSVELAELGYYQSADAYTPEVGDVAFIDTDLDGRADVTAIVVAVDETITVIQGNVSDAVALVEYALDDSIIGYANVTYTSEEEAEEDEEITLDESDEVTAEEIEELDVSAEDFATLEFVGEDYIITVSYGEDAALPEDTELVAYEYAQDSENFLARYEEAAELYGWDDSDETDPYHGFRLFNIGLYYEGAEIEPAASVTVTVTYTGETDAASVSVTHFGDTATETLDATLDQGTDSQSVTFTADGFSEYGIMLTANAETYTVEIVNSIAKDGKLTAVIYDENGDEVAYDSGYEYTWYRSKEPYLTDSEGKLETYPATGYADTSTANYNYLVSTSTSGIGATVDENYCTAGKYVFYYYYVEVVIDGTTYACAPVYASVAGAASYVEIQSTDNGDGTKTLEAVLKGDDYNASNTDITYSYRWYKSLNYEAADGTDATSAPYANTGNDIHDYTPVTNNGAQYASCKLSASDSFYFYYLVVTVTYTNSSGAYSADAKGYQAWSYAGYVGSTDTAAIVDNISSKGTLEAILYKANGSIVDTSEYTVTWYKSEAEYVSGSGTTYTDSTYTTSTLITCEEVTDTYVLSENTVNVAKDSGGLHYYYVVISYGNNTYTSNLKYVQYSDQIENGGFENLATTISNYSQTREWYVYYWHTTSSEYTDKHGSYNGYRKIEIGEYAEKYALAIGTYAIAYTKGGDDAGSFFAEINATESATLYQSVLTAPGTIYYWNVYHQNREYANATSTGEVTTSGQYLYTTTYTGTDSMYVIIMSDADAELLLAEVDKGKYDSQQDVIDAVATAIIGQNNKTTNGSVSVGTGNPGKGEIDGCYSGEFELSDETTVDVTLWQVTTTKTVTRFILYNDNSSTSSNNYADASSLSYSVDDGWVALTDDNGLTYGYYTVTDWVKYSGSYVVPEDQYLTRFFFAAASTQKNNISAGNFIDSVSLTASVDYTIEYWVWNDKTEKYELQDTSEKDSVTPYTRVEANNLSKYSDYVVVGSVTSNVTGGENPTTFDSSTKTSMKVDAYTNYLSIYLKDTGATAEKVISGLSSATLSAIKETVNFTITDSNGDTTTLTVTLEDTSEASIYTELDEGTYTISESGYSTSLLDGKYLWVKAEATGTNITDNNGTYSFTLDSNNTSQTITFTNYYLPVVTLKKVDSTLPSKTLSGVTFEMYKIENETKYYYKSCDDITHKIEWSSSSIELTTDGSGEIKFSALPDGTYYLVETGAADGYNILTETLSFTISGGTITEVKNSEYISIDDSSDSYGLTIIVKNDPGVELPETGGISLPVVYAVGSLMILASAIGLVVRRKKI